MEWQCFVVGTRLDANDSEGGVYKQNPLNLTSLSMTLFPNVGLACFCRHNGISLLDDEMPCKS